MNIKILDKGNNVMLITLSNKTYRGVITEISHDLNYLVLNDNKFIAGSMIKMLGVI